MTHPANERTSGARTTLYRLAVAKLQLAQAMTVVVVLILAHIVEFGWNKHSLELAVPGFTTGIITVLCIYIVNQVWLNPFNAILSEGQVELLAEKIEPKIASSVAQSVESAIPKEARPIRCEVFREKVDGSVLQFIEELLNRLDSKPAEVTMIEYSSHRASTIVESVLSHDVPLHLWLQHPEYAVNSDQKGKIVGALRDLPNTTAHASELMDVTLYRAPASLSAWDIDGRILCLSWYTYERRPNPEDSASSRVPRFVWGHRNPLICFHSGDAAFDYVHGLYKSYLIDLKKDSMPYHWGDPIPTDRDHEPNEKRDKSRSNAGRRH